MPWALPVGYVAALLGALGCTATPEAVAKERAAAELSCPARDRSVVCHGGTAFHLHEQFRCEVRGCEKLAMFRCEAPLQEVGPFESRGDATCW